MTTQILTPRVQGGPGSGLAVGSRNTRGPGAVAASPSHHPHGQGLGRADPRQVGGRGEHPRAPVGTGGLPGGPGGATPRRAPVDSVKVTRVPSVGCSHCHILGFSLTVRVPRPSAEGGPSLRPPSPWLPGSRLLMRR